MEGHGRLANSDCGSLLAHLFSLEVALESVEEESVVGYAVPIEDFLLLLRANAVVLVKEVKELTLGLLQGCIGSRLEVSQI